ncbi:MAG: GNAT family N-acetyltransferase [Xanthobacteraceae bacterium]
MKAVCHNHALSRFELDLDGGELAFARYRLENGLMIFTHTEVPPRGRGRGTGSHLIHGALELARGLNKKVVPRCSFVADYIDRHPEFSDLVA